MTSFPRRSFLRLASAAVAASLLPPPSRADAQPLSEYAGANLEGWEMLVGDGVYAPPDEPPVGAADIQTLHEPTYSELQANVQRRRIMAHNITVKRLWRDDAFDHLHFGRYRFRLPYLPSETDWDLCAQTIEGGLFLWDGAETRRAYGLGFEWILNPWGTTENRFGDLRAWTDRDDGTWVDVGRLTPDTEWHEVHMTLDFRARQTALSIDGQSYASYFAATTKPDDWSARRAALLQAEAISVWPGYADIRALHRAQFSHWYWSWQPYTHRAFLPLVTR
jgi:hypothetical protein